MAIRVSKHAKERILKYGLEQQQVLACVTNPDRVVKGKHGRKVAQNRLNGYVLRVIYEETGKRKTIITAYKAKRVRYEI